MRGVHAYQFSVASDSLCLVHIVIPAVVIHHFREREREIETVKKELSQCYFTCFKCELPLLEGEKNRCLGLTFCSVPFNTVNKNSR